MGPGGVYQRQAPWGQHQLGYGLLLGFVGPGRWLVTFWGSSGRFLWCGLVFRGVPWLFLGVPWPGPLCRGAAAVPRAELFQAKYASAPYTCTAAVKI